MKSKIFVSCFVSFCLIALLSVPSLSVRLAPGKIGFGKVKAAKALGISDMPMIVNSISTGGADRMHQIMADLSTGDLAKNGRLAGENSNVENYLAASFEACGLTFEAGKTSFKQPFNYLFTKCDQVTFNIIPVPLLPSLESATVNWNDPSGTPYRMPLFDDKGDKNPDNWVARQPIVGIDYVVALRAGSAAFTNAEIFYVGSSNKNIEQQNIGNTIVLDPLGISEFDRANLAYKRGAKGYIFRHNLVASEAPGYLTENQTGEVFNGFAQIVASRYLFNELASGGYSAGITITPAEGNGTYRQINNIVGEIPADPSSSVSNEVVIICGHFDGQGTQPGAGQTTPGGSRLIYPSVDDNASAVAIMMETAGVMSNAYKNGWKPMRTIRFIGFNAEEEYYLGANAYLNGLSAEARSNIVAYINMESVAGYLDWTRNMGMADIQHYPRIWDILSQAVIDAQLDPILCVHQHISIANVVKWFNLCGDKLTFVEIAYLGANSYSHQQFFQDFFAFWNYRIPGFSLYETGTPARTDYTHSPYDNMLNLDAYPLPPGVPPGSPFPAFKAFMPITAKLVAATALELGNINSPLKGQITYVP